MSAARAKRPALDATEAARTPNERICEFPGLARRFEAIIFDWDGTAVPSRHTDASRLRELVEVASVHGLDLAIVSGTHVGNVDGQLRARPAGPGGLLLALNRGSELFSVDQRGPHLLRRHSATLAEDTALTRAAQLTGQRLAAHGLNTRIVSERLHRRKIDLIPDPEWENPPKARIGDLLTAVEQRLDGAGIAGLPAVVRIAGDAAREAGLANPRVTSDAKHIEIGLTDKSDSAREIMGWLWERGIAPEQVLIAGDELGALGGLPGSDSLLLSGDSDRASVVSVGVEPGGIPQGVMWLGGGPDAFITVLADQIERRRRGELPILAEDPRWTLTILDVDPLLERVRESLLTLADGRLGTRGSPLTGSAVGRPAVLMSGVYTRTGAETHLLAGPRWNTVQLDRPLDGQLRRVLDLRTGTLRQQSGGEAGPLDALMLSSLTRPGIAVLRARGPIERTQAHRPLRSPPPGVTHQVGEDDGVEWMSVQGRPGSIAAAAHDHIRGRADQRVLDRIAAYDGETHGAADRRGAVDRVRRARTAGFDGLLSEHRREWASRWDEADIAIGGDPDLQLAIRFALLHLMASVANGEEAAVGARGLSGEAYHGHVFWDSDVFVLPFLAATHQPAARAMLEYRVRRLPEALRAARALGRSGAKFPWESAWSGRDVTPQHARDPHGELVPILTGALEEHIVADVAWSAACYIDWTGDQTFATGPGRELLIQTARWWASRVEQDEQGGGHIRGVIGPDEYHDRVDDNVYTNVMARWNLRRAADASGDTVDPRERDRWLELADAIVDGYDAATGIYEQFAGFHALEPLLIAEISPQRPVAADMLLGHERTRDSQVIKQADVLMLHYLVPDAVEVSSLEPNLDFYEPRSAHGSTLSPGVHAALLARAGRLEHALQMLRLTARIDLDDVGHATAGGLHLAAMGGLWRALTYGFAGLRPVGDALAIDPILPSEWQTLDVRLRFRGSRVRCRIRAGAVELTANPPISALGPTGERLRLASKPLLLEFPQLSERRPG